MSTIPYLLTGVTGGLGGKVLEDMLNRLNVPKSSIVVTSRSEDKREQFESQGLQFRILDYSSKESIVKALQGVQEFYFVSASEFDNEKRRVMHQNVVDAVKEAGVKRTWYVSLAFGGFDVNRDVSIQTVHNWTEEMLINAEVDFVSLRAGVYADAFPLFINWFPDSKAIRFPEVEPSVKQGRLALTSREELGEAMATLFTKGYDAFSIKPQGERRIVLLTAAETVTFIDVADAVNRARPNNQIPIEFLESQAWVDNAFKNDESGKPRAWWESRLVWFEQMCRGALKTTDPALEILLGRKPLNGVQLIENLVGDKDGYTWHQTSKKSG